jgi:aminopeptidase
VDDGGVLDPQSLARYAEAMVKDCAAVRRGDLVVLQGAPDHRELLVALAEAAYRRGAGLVEVSYTDPRVRAARIRYGREETLGAVAPWARARARRLIGPDAAVLSVTGEGDPDVYAGLPPQRIARDEGESRKQLGFYLRAALSGRVRWAGGAWPTEAWAAQVYPELPVADARRALGRDLLWFARLTDEDGEGTRGWREHVRTIAARARRLSRLRLERLELRGPGTELDIRLAPGTVWLGGTSRTAYGQLTAPNIPTEECFTSPLAGAAEGTFRCLLPLSFAGRMIEGIAGEFRGGRLVRLEAKDDDDRDFLAAYLDTDRNARRLGEVALVDASSRIGQKRRTYFNTLLDENAAAHIAFGAGFAATRQEGHRRGVNSATLHLDVMIGSDDFEATGVAARDRRVPLIADGVWQLG